MAYFWFWIVGQITQAVLILDAGIQCKFLQCNLNHALTILRYIILEYRFYDSFSLMCFSGYVDTEFKPFLNTKQSQRVDELNSSSVKYISISKP